MWVTDLDNGAQDFCIATIDVQDSGNCLSGLRGVYVGGSIVTEANTEVEGVEVYLDGSGDMAITDTNGGYAFPNMPIGGNYIVNPVNDTDYLNGVSTLDLIMMQRHILGIDQLSSPYKYIAADINNSGTINGIDLVELRKLILGIYDELPSNSSWRFVSSDYSFASESAKWLDNWKEEYEILELNSNMQLDFVGVKIGDVNNSVVTSLGESIEIRSKASVTLHTSSDYISKGERGVIRFSSPNYNKVNGLQGTLEFDSEDFDLLAVNSHELEMEAKNNYNASRAHEGLMTFSHSQVEPTSYTSDQILFEMVVLAKRDLSANEQLVVISSSITSAEAYTDQLQTVNLILEGQVEDTETGIVSINPNPWINNAEITVDMQESDRVELDFYDLNGRRLYKRIDYLESGSHKLQINKNDLEHRGIVIVRMKAGTVISEYRMMVY